MSVISTKQYSHAFGRYLRDGTPISLSLKQGHASEKYVWHTRGDDKVRISHRANDGRLFSWVDPPDTQHPGEDYGCRCNAVPYIRGETEYVTYDLIGRAGGAGNRWSDRDFVAHFFSGGGAVTLREIGHLNEIIEYYFYHVGSGGVLQRLNRQIAKEARDAQARYFMHDFYRSYDFGAVEYSHGKAKVSGVFEGGVEKRDKFMIISGNISFIFTDEFTDPLGVREFLFGESDRSEISDWFLGLTDLGGTAYQVTDSWDVSFLAEILTDSDRSSYQNPEP